MYSSNFNIYWIGKISLFLKVYMIFSIIPLLYLTKDFIIIFNKNKYPKISDSFWLISKIYYEYYYYLSKAGSGLINSTNNSQYTSYIIYWEYPN